ncbi:MAG: hypothetical protein M0T84_05165 [Betaproteobacteria bacterium]|nr:hypothetical protein [Betaproteobacteria bacterium]
MLRVSGDRFTRVDRPAGEGRRLSLAEAGVREEEHLREYIARSPADFFGELQQEVLILDKEVSLANGRLRSDIVGIDPDGTVVVIELKRSADRDQHLQALNYAAQIWKPEAAGDGGGVVAAKLEAEQLRKAVTAFLRVPLEQVNRRQRIVLVAEDYYPTTLRTVHFLIAQHALDIKLWRVELHEFPDGRYLACRPVVIEEELRPAPDSQRPRRVTPRERQEVADELAAWRNPALAAFVEAHADSTGTTTAGLVFFLPANGRSVRFALDRRKECAGRVLQSQRFVGDIDFWRKHLPEVALREKERKKGEGRNPLQWLLPDRSSLEAFVNALAQLPQEG